MEISNANVHVFPAPIEEHNLEHTLRGHKDACETYNQEKDEFDDFPGPFFAYCCNEEGWDEVRILDLRGRKSASFRSPC